MLQVDHHENVSSMIDSDHSICGLVVSTPTSTHSSIIQCAADASHLTAVFVEKPVDETADQIRDTFNYCANKLQLCCGYQRRFDPSYVAITDAVQKGDLGKQIVYAHAFFADHPVPPRDFLLQGGNIFMDLSAHDIDYIVHTLKTG